MTTPAPTVTCPLCRSENVHKAGHTMDLAIYACDACNAQFTIQVPRLARPAVKNAT
jgi:transposase-like protein